MAGKVRVINFDDIINDIELKAHIYSCVGRSNYIMNEDRKRHDAQFIQDIWASAMGMDEIAKTFYLLGRWCDMVRLN